MAPQPLDLALIHDVFHGPDGPDRLAQRLTAAKHAGATLAVLPELPLHRWIPATRTPREADAEPPEGSLHRAQAEAARAAGVALLGGAIVRDPRSGLRHNRALLFDAQGRLVARYDKLHVPQEEGYWEADHYAPGTRPPARVDGFALPLGIQICSDLNRPEGCHLLGAAGCGVVLAPRATPRKSYERWKLVIRADAITSGLYVVSVNRPPEPGAGVGGPSIAVGPDGSVLAESTEPLTIVHLDPTALAAARHDYPGYLDVRAALYAEAWAAIGRTPRPDREDAP